ncbi:tRNA threonylcarbamoyladenosine biosynthesis protein TsaE [Breznakibacter xylanolyticus]|uniref:tRNA threonylcarbamoyladenosine biosynthesis protein TsaE n=1 Tax=Breznakibacter xylanolyticus TaxID=990 RepID=A0A2W7NK05_9BACT|nr:tRNA (adenosine(37)-N6)-threonylcarbamoyltransferase complex ATPase subunit type 1 TsaE [Breznakibacter xylanolyticus]MBN2742861.1 tRNA (adenosine(37)-N6)-threonylcarbamoyltransferase complex ATPase subunit type 1 TsaE [Marinilabiliaceae bacterium]PZX20608.1 tRNA threonylcarbamoyladenosine biosynthesis protein TsaE [Breznakibacter xylanolyticus]
MAQESFIIPDVAHINMVAANFLAQYPTHRILAFRGDMGVGKTTFIKALCHELGVTDVVNSPSFAIVNEYETAHHNIIYHFDFYRLKNMDEAYDMGYEDYLYSGNYCFLEWPDKIESLLPDQRLDLYFEELPDNSRQITVRQPAQ